MVEQNPFLVPEGSATPSGGFDLGGRQVDAGRGIEWLKQGWQTFARNPGVWIAITVIMLVIYVVLGMVPFIGQLAASVLTPVLTAGPLLGCKALAEGGELRIDHLFAGFKENVANLVMVGVFYLVGMGVIMGVAFLIGGGGAVTGAIMGRGPGVGVAAGGFLLAMLVMLALSVPLIMAMWFAPALVVFHNVAPLEAMKASFGACLKNLAAFLIYGVIAFVLLFVAALPFGLGLLVLLPILLGSLYAAYVEIFE
jgi:uncharacterized membrane protein